MPLPGIPVKMSRNRRNPMNPSPVGIRKTTVTTRTAFCLLVIFALTMTVAASAPTLTQPERDSAIAELQGSRQAFLDATKGLTPAQWSFKAAPDPWSIADCADHIPLTPHFIFPFATTP